MSFKSFFSFQAIVAAIVMPLRIQSSENPSWTVVIGWTKISYLYFIISSKDAKMQTKLFDIDVFVDLIIRVVSVTLLIVFHCTICESFCKLIELLLFFFIMTA